MTNEEIEKQAVETAQRISKPCLHITCNQYCSMVKQAFQDGAKWGMEHQWHDLRKTPADLPKCEEKQQIIFFVKEFNTDIGKDISHFCLGFYAKSFLNDDIKVFIEKSKGYECEHLSQEVIKWCELPQFKE